ncbi:MAG: sulfotransferase [Planctomycetota bacterium]|nr:sulfotransferase [Planctomycetota bacterium]
MRRSMPRIIASLGVRPATRFARHEIKRAFVRLHPWFNTNDTCDDRAVIIGGCGRSGTTLLREMLDRHPNLAMGPETSILCDMFNPSNVATEWQLSRAEVEALARSSTSVVRFAESFFRQYSARRGKPRWGDKTPANVRNVARILKQFPRATFIHVIRDGRDVACSLRHHPKEIVRKGKIIPNTVNRPIAVGARRWLDDTTGGAAFHGHPRVVEVRYEQLVSDPARELSRLCAALGEDFVPEMAAARDPDRAPREPGRLMNNSNAGDPINTRSVARWKRDLSPTERQDFARVAGELLVTLGYAKDHSWVVEG